jgi:hypothetical protein
MNQQGFSLAETAKLLSIPGMGRCKLVRFLRQEGILLAGDVPARRYLKGGYFLLAGPPEETSLQVSAKGVVFLRVRLDHYLQQYMERQLLAR